MVTPRKRPRIIETRNCKNFNIDAFSGDLQKLPWKLIEELHDPNQIWLTWKALFNKVLDVHAPVRAKRVRNLNVPWIPPDLKAMIFRRDYLKKRAVKNRSDTNWREYCNMRNKVNYKLKASKRKFFINNLDANKGNTRKTWKLLNSLLNKPTKTTAINVIKKDADIIKNRKCIAENFNAHFIEMEPKFARGILYTTISPTTFLKHTINVLKFKYISTECVVATINDIPSKKASGLDRILCKVIK